MHPNKMGLVLCLSLGLALAFAGCTGQFDVEQTEPFRVQIEDGETRTVEVSSDDDEPERIVVANDNGVEEIDIDVRAMAVSEGRTTIMVTVMDEETEEVYAEREIVVRDETPTGNDTDDNETNDGDERITQVIQNVNIRGSNNIVILTQATEGDAEVDITAQQASGQADVDADNGDDTGDGQTGGDGTSGDGGNQTDDGNQTGGDGFFDDNETSV